jgi:aminoglycoside phosphotransferase (APT) family kinase protein
VRRPEPEANRSGDWRFLLPSAGTEHARHVIDPGSKELEETFEALPPGAVCYFEWRSRARPSARSLKRRLATAGFVGVRLYWSWPREIPSVWVPVEAPAAGRWVLRRKHRALAQLAWRAASATRLIRPRCATAVRPPLAERVGPLGVPLADFGRDPFWALLAPGSDSLKKVLAFIGVPGRDDPVLVLKMPRTEAAIAALEREAASLHALHASGTAPAGVPRVVYTHRDGTVLRAVAESPLEGKPLFELLDRRRQGELAQRATEWLVELARESQATERRRKTALDLAADAADSAPPAHRALLTDAGRLASAADSLPVAFEQRDFSPWNVHVGHDGGLVVFDWESAEPEGFPGLDLIYLLAYCGFFLDGALGSGRERESYRGTMAGSLARECLTRYCRALAIDLDRLPALRTLTWIVHLRSALRRDPGGAGASLFLDLLREEVATADAPVAEEV